MVQYKRMNIPRGLLTGTAAALTIVWGLYALDPGRSLVASAVQTGVYLGLLGLTARSRRLKVLLARSLQRRLINPVVRGGLALGLNPLGLAVLETRGRVSGRPRRVPVGNGRSGAEFWVIAEHGHRAGYVRNIAKDPWVRVRLRVGLRYRWFPGYATIRPGEDPLARQRRLIRWHPLRALNAVTVRVMGADLLVVHIRLDPDGAAAHHRAEPATSRPEVASGPAPRSRRGSARAGVRPAVPTPLLGQDRLAVPRTVEESVESRGRPPVLLVAPVEPRRGDPLGLADVPEIPDVGPVLGAAVGQRGADEGPPAPADLAQPEPDDELDGQ